MVRKMKVFRVMCGKSQLDVSFETGISQSRISLIENGYVVPSEEEKKDLAEALNRDPEDLF